jgi:Uma2 family endonuclease
MGKALQSDYRTTIEAFHAFVDDRPDWEKWELIDGEIILNPTPTNRHEIVVHNLQYELEVIRRRVNAPWLVHAGIGTRLPEDQHNEPIPDVMIVPESSGVFNSTFDVLAAFEVLSPFSVRRDMVHKRNFYTRVERLESYVVLAQDRQEATVFARADGFAPKSLRGATARVEIPPLGVSIPLADIYRNVAID